MDAAFPSQERFSRARGGQLGIPCALAFTPDGQHLCDICHCSRPLLAYLPRGPHLWASVLGQSAHAGENLNQAPRQSCLSTTLVQGSPDGAPHAALACGAATNCGHATATSADVSHLLLSRWDQSSQFQQQEGTGYPLPEEIRRAGGTAQG